MKFRVFTNDIGKDRYSCFTSFEAKNDDEARRKAEKSTAGLPSGRRDPVKVLVVREDRPETWPDGKTGRLSMEGGKR